MQALLVLHDLLDAVSPRATATTQALAGLLCATIADCAAALLLLDANRSVVTAGGVLQRRHSLSTQRSRRQRHWRQCWCRKRFAAADAVQQPVRWSGEDAHN